MDLAQTDIVVIGGGPGGYAAAFYAADQGRRVVLVEKDEQLGGVCLNRGCIPSKALLNATKIVSQARESARRGIAFAEPKLDIAQLRDWKNTVVAKLTAGLSSLAKGRKVEVVQGHARFSSSSTVLVETNEGQHSIPFEHAIIATGSRAALPREFDVGIPNVMTSRAALNLEQIPDQLLVVGGGYIGLELGSVYARLGSQVSLVETLPSLLSGADADLIRPIVRHTQSSFKEIRLNTKVKSLASREGKIGVNLELADDQTVEELYDGVLVTVGRVPNGNDLGLANTAVRVDEGGFIQTTANQQTEDPKIYAIGDVAGGPLLAHKATKEARIAVDAINSQTEEQEPMIVPAVVFTDPELAWCGLTEQEAKYRGIQVEVAKFPWAASGRAITYDRMEGLTKLIVEPATERVLGIGIVGVGAGELISEAALAIRLGATARDLSSTIHPHPTLSETLMEAAEVFYGHPTHILPRKRKP